MFYTLDFLRISNPDLVMTTTQTDTIGLRIMNRLEATSRRRWNYWLVITIEATLTLSLAVCMLLNLFSEQRFLFQVPFAVIIGAVIQSFVEYGVHRWLYHGRLALRPGGHAEHHQHPFSLLALPWFVTIALFVAGTSAYCLAFGDFVLGVAAATGGGIQYLAFGFLHHSYHHQNFGNRSWRRLRARHHVHHALSDCNFGGTTRLWDIVFRTEHLSNRATATEGN